MELIGEVSFSLNETHYGTFSKGISLFNKLIFYIFYIFYIFSNCRQLNLKLGMGEIKI